MEPIEVEVRETGIPEGVRDLVEALPDPFEVPDDANITLKFPNQYVFTTGLALLATWRSALSNGVSVRIDDANCEESARRLLKSRGFVDIIQHGQRAQPPTFRGYGTVPLLPIVQGADTQNAISAICSALASFSGSLHDPRAFNVLLSELCENALVHAELHTPAYFCANIHRTRNAKRLEIAIADAGIGIRNSYLEGTNQIAKDKIKAGVSPLDLAVEGLFSSKRDPKPGSFRSHFGYGLFLARRLVDENHGRMTVISGDECLNTQRYERKVQSLKNGWRGTFVGLLLDLDRPLPLDEIYEQAAREATRSSPAPPSTPAAEAPAKEPVRVSLGDYGAQLLTREVGVIIRADIATALASGAAVIVSMDGIEDLTPSVADECFGKLAESLGQEQFELKVKLAGGSPLISRLIQLVVSNRLNRS